MKTKYLFLFLLFQLHHCFGQEVEKEVLYFIMAYNYTKYDELSYDEANNFKRKTFESILFRLEWDSLKSIAQLNSDIKSEMRLLRNFNNPKMLYFEEYESSLMPKPKYISILDYQDKLIIRRYNPKWDPNFNEPFRRIVPIINNKKFIICNEQKAITRDYFLKFGRDKYFNKYELKSEDFNNIYPEGYPGFQRTMIDSYSYQYWDKNQFLRIPYDNLDGTNPIAWIQEPDSLKKGDYMYVEINNDKYFIGCPDLDTTFSDTTIRLEIFNKSTLKWSTQLIPGLMRMMMCYNYWIYGTAKTLKGYNYFVDYNKLDSSFKTRYDLTYGNRPDLEYYPGILYLCYLPTHKLIKWYPGDRDSEIISIHEGTIYYRVFDELRTVELDSIKNEINWPSQKLLIKDKKRVPNIHWMFFAPKQDKVEEVWVNRPKGIKE